MLRMKHRAAVMGHQHVNYDDPAISAVFTELAYSTRIDNKYHRRLQ